MEAGGIFKAELGHRVCTRVKRIVNVLSLLASSGVRVDGDPREGAGGQTPGGAWSLSQVEMVYGCVQMAARLGALERSLGWRQKLWTLLSKGVLRRASGMR